MNCPACGRPLPESARTCPSCGAAIDPARGPPASAGPPALGSAASPLVASGRTAAGLTAKLQPLEWAIVAGALIAVAATFLRWFEIEVSAFGLSEGASAWDGELGEDLRLSRWLGGGLPFDALAVVLLAVACIYLVAGPAVGLKAPPAGYAPLVLGVALVLIGVLNWVHIEEELEGFEIEDAGFSAGAAIGVYLVIVAGLLIAFASFLLRRGDVAER